MQSKGFQFTRKVQKIQNSFYINLPKEICKSLGLDDDHELFISVVPDSLLEGKIKAYLRITIENEFEKEIGET